MTTAVNDFLGDDAFSTQATIPGQGTRRGRNRARHTPRTWDGRKHQGTPRIHGTAYGVSPADARCESLGGAPTKGDDAMRGKNSPRTRHTPPHCGQRAGSAGSMPVEATAGNANLGSAVSGAQRFPLPLEREEKETMPSLPHFWTTSPMSNPPTVPMPKIGT